MRLSLSEPARKALEALPEGLEKAQLRGTLKRLAENDAADPHCSSPEVPGGRFFFAGAKDEWKITYRVVEIEDEEVISVVTIKKRRTLPWAIEFFPKGDCQ